MPKVPSIAQLLLAEDLHTSHFILEKGVSALSRLDLAIKGVFFCTCDNSSS